MEPPLKLCKGILCNGIEKPLTDFSPRASQCKKCVCHAQKERYKKHDRPYRVFKNEIKANGKCAECGISDMRVLDFDHNKGEKNITVCKSFSKAAIKNELALTQLLCAWCHRLKSRKEMDDRIEVANEKYTITERPTTKEEGKPCHGKICNGQLQFHSMFYDMKKKTYCKLCYSWKSKLIRQQNYEFLKQQKLKAKECELCKKQVSEDTLCCFDYDHIHPEEKYTTVSVYVRKSSDMTQQMLEEIKKCRLLCCNCHRIHTTSQFKYKMDETYAFE
jgi:hypothetical protein